MGEESGAEKLFLLEFLVDYVCIERTNSMLKGMDNDPCLWNRSQTCVTFQFLDYPPLEINQEDFDTKKCAQDGISLFKNGKSCLFSVPGNELSKTSVFAVDVAVHKKLPPEVLPGQVLVGNTTIQLADIFSEITNIVKKNPECVPVSKTMKNGYLIQNSCGNVVGEIKVFIRLSCFGKLIVTQFELGAGNKPYLFKGSEGNDVYECQKLESKTNAGGCSKSKSPPLPPPGLPPPGHRPIMMGGGFGPQMYAPQYPQRQIQPYPLPYPPMVQQPCPPCSPPSFGNSNICSPEVCVTKDDKDFEEIGAEVNGHALKIRVPKKKKKKGASCGPCAPCTQPSDINCGPCAPCNKSSEPAPAAQRTTVGGCGPCSPCGDISAAPIDVTNAQGNASPGCQTCHISNPYTVQSAGTNNTDGWGPCSPCGTHSQAPQIPMSRDSCGPCAPCGSNFAPLTTGMETCGPCAPCASTVSNNYETQQQTTDPCGPCAPCGNPPYAPNPYEHQNPSMEACGPCAPCATPSYGNIYSSQKQSMNPCGPCSPCADPYSGQMPQTIPYSPCPPYEPYPQTMQYGGQMYGQEICPPQSQPNQMIFNQPCKPGKNPEANLFYKVTACPEECTVGAGGSCKKAIKIEPQIGVQKMNDLPENLGRDVFVLRIGKQGDSPDHKSNLELELRTPKRPPPPSEMKETQYSLTDTAGKAEKRKENKGKKGKDKKGKKKKNK